MNASVSCFQIISRLILILIFACNNLYALMEGKLGKIDASATLSAEYDSRVFGISSESYYGAKNSSSSNIVSSEIKSEDDFIIRFSPALHFSKKVKWFSFTGSAGVEFAQYLKNDDKSYTQPITTFSIDFDETLSKQKRVSNNAKIRFDATFDLGQKVGASVLDQDLVSYTYFTAGLNVRYNHSAKFGVGGGTSYTIQHNQAGATQERPYQDLTTLPLSARAFYIYSQKLDFYTNYTFQRSKDNQSGSTSLTDSTSHSISFGTQGEISSKLSGNANIGYSIQNFDNDSVSKQDNLITGVGLDWKLNSKTSFGFGLDRAFSPSAQGFSTFSTMGQFSVSHRFTEDVTGRAYLSAGNIKYTYPPSGVGGRIANDSSSLNSYGCGINLQKRFTDRISGRTGYDYTFTDRDTDSYGRHVIKAEVTGRF
jgi:hypothetical protein